MSAEAPSSSPTHYFPVEQRSDEWKTIRRPISGTKSSLLGFCSFTRPRDAYYEAVTGKSRRNINQTACDHGNKYEEASERVFRLWLTTTRQEYTLPGYDVPNPLANNVFTEERDALRFGVSLDVRGSIIDCEIKNPTTLRSYTNYYKTMFSPAYFFQVQWAMAIRNRQTMYFIATSHNAETGKLEAYSIWLVSFADEFFREYILSKMRRIADRILAKDLRYRIEEEESPWINEGGEYTRSFAYKTLFSKFCELKFSYPE